MTYPDKYCPTCGKLFVPARSNQVYCSKSCGSKARGKRVYRKRMKDSKVCRVCGRTFTPSYELRAFCSTKCQMSTIVTPKTNGICEYCGEEFLGPKGKKYCSKDCQRLANNARHRKEYAENYQKFKVQKIARKKGEKELNGIITQANEKGASYGRFMALRYLQEHKYDIIKGEYV